MYRYLRYLPKDHLSRAAGHLMHIRWPRPLASRLVRWFAGAYRIDVEAAAKPLDQYPSIGDFFVRDLRDGLRPIESDLVSPVDGTLRGYGVVTDGRLVQVKGKDYTVARFLADEAAAARYDGGVYFNLYLSPQDYHHIHSPVTGGIAESAHIPGKLWPVNDWSMANVDELFAVNERVITYVDSPTYGRVCVAMIGATNVGKISVTYDSFISNTAGARFAVRRYEPPIAVRAGDRLGTFHMGSSVVVLFEPGRVDLSRVQLPVAQKVRYGMAILGAG